MKEFFYFTYNVPFQMIINMKNQKLMSILESKDIKIEPIDYNKENITENY